MNLTPEQLMILGFAASAITWLIKAWQEKSGKPISREILTGILFALSVVFALLFAFPALPSLPPAGTDPSQMSQAILEFISALIAAAGGVVGFATLIYNFLLKRILVAAFK